FHAPGALENKFHMKLVLGQTPERFTIDDPAGNGTLYLERWNEFKFATVTMRLAIQQLLMPERQQRMLEEIVRRTHEIAPISAGRLAKESSIPRQPDLPSMRDSCITSLTNASLAGQPCGPLRPVPVR